MLLKYISIWQWGNGLSCTSGVLAVSGDFVLSGWLPGVKRGHTSQLPHVRPWPAGHEHDSTGSQRNPAHKICITGVLRRMRAHSPVEQIFCYLWQATDEEKGLPVEHFNHCFAPLSVIYDDCYSWGMVTPATREHSWRVQDGSMWQKNISSPFVTLQGLLSRKQ